MLFNFLLLLVELQLHCLQLLGQEDILGLELLSRDRQLLVFFLHVDEVGAYPTQFLLSLIDLVHIVARFESTFLDKLFEYTAN